MYLAYLIKKFDKQPKWKGPQFDKGIYAIRIHINDINTSCFAGNAEYAHGDFGPFKQFTLFLKRGTRQWLQAMAAGNITFDGPHVIIIGQFEKIGSEIYFSPETVAHYDSPY